MAISDYRYRGVWPIVVVLLLLLLVYVVIDVIVVIGDPRSPHLKFGSKMGQQQLI